MCVCGGGGLRGSGELVFLSIRKLKRVFFSGGEGEGLEPKQQAR